MTAAPTATGRVVSLVRYPVKSLGGEEVDRARVEARGLEHDRLWATYTADGFIGSGKRTRRFRPVDGLLHWTATMSDGVPLVTAPDGRRWRADDPAAAAALGKACGQPLSLRTESDVRHHDDAAVHVLTTASVRALAERVGAPLDARRFRANLLVDLDEDAGSSAGQTDTWPEDGWIGRTLTVGEVVLRLTAPMPRCVMVNAAQPGLDEDARVLRSLSDRAARLGLMAEVVSPGLVRRGDRVVVG